MPVTLVLALAASLHADTLLVTEETVTRGGPAPVPSSPAPAARVALAANSADSLVVLKAARRLEVYVGDVVVRRYQVALGKNPVGRKRTVGDGRTPEGLYVIDWRNPRSRYYRALHVSYPNAVDRFLAREQGTTAGGDIMIHGLPADAGPAAATHWLQDWTEGCVAVTNAEMDELWFVVGDGTRIRIRP